MVPEPLRVKPWRLSRTPQSYAQLSAKQCETEANPSSAQTSGDIYKPSAVPKRSIKYPFPWKSRVKTARHFLEPKAHLTHQALSKEPMSLLCHIPGRVPCCSLPRQDGEMSDGSKAHDSYHQCPVGWRDEVFSKRNEQSFLCRTISKARTGWENKYKLKRHNPSISK